MRLLQEKQGVGAALLNKYWLAIVLLSAAIYIIVLVIFERVVPYIVFFIGLYVALACFFRNAFPETALLILVGIILCLLNVSVEVFQRLQIPNWVEIIMVLLMIGCGLLCYQLVIKELRKKGSNRKEACIRLAVFLTFFCAFAYLYHTRFFPAVVIRENMTCEDMGWKRANHPVQIIDIFTLNVEIEMLKLRLEMHAPFVDYIMIVESDRSFQGKEKPFYLDTVWKQLPIEWRDKIIRVRIVESDATKQEKNCPDKWCPIFVNMPPGDHTAAYRRLFQRNQLIYAMDLVLPKHKLHEWVIFSDLDEVMDPNLLSLVRSCSIPKSLEVLLLSVPEYIYHFNCAATVPWMRPRIARRNTLGDKCASWLREYWVKPFTCVGHLREEAIFFKYFPFGGLMIQNGGWHMSWFMTMEQMKIKIQSNAEKQRNTAENLQDAKLKGMVEKCQHFSGQTLEKLSFHDRHPFYTLPKVSKEWRKDHPHFFLDPRAM